MLQKRGSAEFCYLGWDDDQRELFEIPEVRKYYHATLDAEFPWIYWLEPDVLWAGYGLLYTCGCDVNITKVGSGHRVEATTAAHFKAWIERNFNALNVFTEKNGIPDEINRECSMNFKRFLDTLMV